MTPAQIITECDEFGYATVASARKYAYLNDALDWLTGLESWPWLEAILTLRFAGSSSTPSNSPSDLTHVLRITHPVTGNRVEPVRSEDFQTNFAASLTMDGEPSYYYFDGYTLKFHPRPRSSDTLTMRYTKFQADVSSGDAESAILCPPRFHWILVWKTLSYLALRDDDVTLSKYYSDLADMRVELMRKDIWTRTQYDRQDTVQVVDDYSALYDHF